MRKPSRRPRARIFTNGLSGCKARRVSHASGSSGDVIRQHSGGNSPLNGRQDSKATLSRSVPWPLSIPHLSTDAFGRHWTPGSQGPRGNASGEKVLRPHQPPVPAPGWWRTVTPMTRDSVSDILGRVNGSTDASAAGRSKATFDGPVTSTATELCSTCCSLERYEI